MQKNVGKSRKNLNPFIVW